MFAQFRFDHYQTLFLLYLHKCRSCVIVMMKSKRVLHAKGERFRNMCFAHSACTTLFLF